MKTLRKVPIELVDVKLIPPVLEFGKFYYSKTYETASHLCVCGCGQEIPIPIKEGEWSVSVRDGKLTVTPSLLHRFQCRAHYIITDGVANIVRDGLPKSMWYPELSNDPGE